MRSKVYISGKMTGDPNYKERFAKAAERLYELGMWPVNPAEFFDKYPLGYAQTLILDLQALSQCGCIYMLSGWEDSPGARVEKAFADATGIGVMYEMAVIE